MSGEATTKGEARTKMEELTMQPRHHWITATAAVAVMLGLAVTTPFAADSTKVDRATRQVEQGAHKVGEGKVGQGVEETAKGIGNTVVEGAKYTGRKFEEAGRAAEPGARSAGRRVKEGASAFGSSVKNFFTSLFGGK
jgi:hypothetical protein